MPPMRPLRTGCFGSPVSSPERFFIFFHLGLDFLFADSFWSSSFNTAPYFSMSPVKKSTQRSNAASCAGVHCVSFSLFRMVLLISSSFHSSFSSFSENVVFFSPAFPGLDLENRAVFSIKGAPMGYGTIGAPSVGNYSFFAGVDGKSGHSSASPFRARFGPGLPGSGRALAV